MDEVTLTNFLNSGTTSIIVKIILVIMLIYASILAKKWQIEKARKQEDDDATHAQQDITQGNKPANEQAQKDSQAVDDFLK